MNDKCASTPLVAVSAAVFGGIASRLAGHDGAVHVVAHVVSGIGFLGARAVMKQGAFEPPPKVGQTSKGSMKKYRAEFKLEVVQSFLTGEGGAKLLARQWSVPEEKIRTWVSHYRMHGICHANGTFTRWTY